MEPHDIPKCLEDIREADPNYPIQSARKIVDLRNWVIHAYDNVNNTIIWSIVTRHLPTLKTEVERLLG